VIEHYDEFGLFPENAAEVGLAWSGPPVVERVSVPVDGDRRLSALRWGQEEPEIVLLHGGAQNAHTWDTVLLALDRPALAIDLPGHGHSDWREDHAYSPQANAADVAVAVELMAPDAGLVVGMSLGGLTAFCHASLRPDLVRRLAVVDVTPGTDHAKAEPIVTFISGPEVFGSFQEILDRTVEFNPTRRVSSLRRGILHNAKENPDGTWTWRWDPVKDWDLADGQGAMPHFGRLWEHVDAVTAPIRLLRGGAEGSVVADEDVEELLRRQPGAEVITVEGAGHSIQGDRPLELADHLEDFLGS
jgi:pimeloyl-ACP methyl ester carboxylesterase